MIEALLLLAAGPISKWNDERPDLDYASKAAMHDVERCLSDLPGYPAPIIHRYPDRPGESRLLYQVGSKVAGRADLQERDGITRIATWRIGKSWVLACAPPAD